MKTRRSPVDGPVLLGAAAASTLEVVCRNIRNLYNFEPPTTHDEVHEAALQYVRKVSGMTKPSQANEEAFARAVEAVAHATEELLGELVTTAARRDRDVEAERRRARFTASRERLQSVPSGSQHA
jgi:hypothetical protein